VRGMLSIDKTGGLRAELLINIATSHLRAHRVRIECSNVVPGKCLHYSTMLMYECSSSDVPVQDSSPPSGS